MTGAWQETTDAGLGRLLAAVLATGTSTAPELRTRLDGSLGECSRCYARTFDPSGAVPEPLTLEELRHLDTLDASELPDGLAIVEPPEPEPLRFDRELIPRALRRAEPELIEPEALAA